MDETMIGRGRDAIDMIIDAGSFEENTVGANSFDPDYGPGAVVGTATLEGACCTVIATDAQAVSPRFPVVYFGVIGMEEAYKMGVPAIISADAHHFSEITLEFATAEEALKKAGYRSVVNFKNGQWIDVPLA